MPTAVKTLYMASNIQDLNKQACIDSTVTKINSKGIDTIIKSAERVLQTAKQSMTEDVEDEELIYTYLYRSMELWNIYIKSNEYKKDPKYSNLMYRNKIAECLELLDVYSKKLKERYSQLNVVEEDINELDQYKLTSSIKVKKMKGGEDKRSSITSNGINNSLKANEETQNEKALFDIKMIPQSQSQTENMDYYGGKKFIECLELRDLILENPSDVLIVDVRAKKDFEASKLVKTHNINIPETSIIAGLSANKLGWLITNEKEKTYWDSRDQYKQLVLMDWRSEKKDVIPNSPLSNIQNILLKWDPDVVYKNHPLVLNGGFEKLLDMYPTLTSNANIERPPKPIIDQFIHLSEHNIEYPLGDLDDIRPKSVPKSPVPDVHRPLRIPAVDRTTKPSSLAKPEVNIRGQEATNELTKKTAIEETEPMEDDVMNMNTANEQSFAMTSTPEPSLTTQQPVRPVTPPATLEKSYPTTPKQSTENGEGDGLTSEKLKFGSTHRSGGLKKSSSSPNITKLYDGELDDLFSKATPTFDRSTKPKPTYNFDSYSSRGGNMDTIYLTQGKKGRGLTGLKNLGNLCYMNSIMQCISNTVELTQELTRFNVGEVSTRRQIASEVSMLLRVLWQGDTRVYTCRELKSRVGSLRPTFSTSEQQDSHEFLTILMDWLHEDLNEPSPVKSLSGADEATGEKAWGEFKKKNNSLILDLFYGQLKSTVTCTYCQKQSVLFEPFSNLSVPLPANQDMPYEKDRKYTLQECLKLYLTGETISGWVCPVCKTPREATKKLDITRLPPVLIIHLKRFMSDMVGVGWCRKRMNMVDFPINDFNMRPYTHPSSELRNHSYNLYAVSNHYGSMESGHYTAYCKNHLLNKWYKFDDQDVGEISPADVKSSAAYILFYESANLERDRHLD